MPPTNLLLNPRPYPESVSLVLPIFNEEEVIPLLLPRLDALIEKIPCETEIIFVNDGSSDGSQRLLEECCQEKPNRKLISLARNFGHQAAASAGLDYAQGQVVVLMDADLQDPPELVLSMIDKYCSGYDVVYARRTSREGETSFKRFTAWAFYRIMKTLVHKELPVDVGDYRLMSRRCLDALNVMRETHRFLRGMVTWIGFPQTAVEFARPARAAGQTKYPLRKMLLFAWNAALSFSPLPLRLGFAVGSLLFCFGAIYMVWAAILKVLGLYAVPGWTSLIGVICAVGGANMIFLGIVGEYVARIYEESKRRPLYVVSASCNLQTTPYPPTL